MATSWVLATILVFVVIETPVTSQITNKTPHWERCYDIIKANRTGKCTQNQSYNCHAKKVYVTGSEPETCSHDDGCPAPISDLHVSVYEESANKLAPEQSLHRGANISWTVSKTATDADYGTKMYEIVIIFLSKKNDTAYLIAEVTVELTPDDYIQDKAEIYYDCFYPLPKNRSMSVTIKTIPINEGSVLTFNFTTAEVTITTTTEENTGTTATEGNKGITITEGYKDTTTTTEGNTITNVDMTSSYMSLAIGLILGTLFLSVLVLSIFIARRCLPCKHKEEMVTSILEKDAINVPSQHEDKEADVDPVLLVYAQDDDDDRSWRESLSLSLSRHCKVVDIWQFQRDNVYAALQNARFVVLVLSEKLCMLLKGITSSDDELIAVVFKILKQSKTLQAKVVAVYFESNKEINVDILPFKLIGPLPLPDQESELLRILRTSHVDSANIMLDNHDKEICISGDSGYICGPDTPSLIPDVYPFIPTDRQVLPGRALSCEQVQYIPSQVYAPCNHGYRNYMYCHTPCPPCSPLYEQGVCPPHYVPPHTDGSQSLTTTSCPPVSWHPPHMYGSFSDMESVLSSEVYDINRHDNNDLSNISRVFSRRQSECHRSMETGTSSFGDKDTGQ